MIHAELRLDGGPRIFLYEEFDNMQTGTSVRQIGEPLSLEDAAFLAEHLDTLIAKAERVQAALK